MMIECKYGCKCEVDFVPFLIHERFENEGIVQFVNRAATSARELHDKRSPFCKRGKVDLMLWMSQNGVGVSGPELTEQDKAEIVEMLKKPTGSK